MATSAHSYFLIRTLISYTPREVFRMRDRDESQLISLIGKVETQHKKLNKLKLKSAHSDSRRDRQIGERTSFRGPPVSTPSRFLSLDRALWADSRTLLSNTVNPGYKIPGQ